MSMAARLLRNAVAMFLGQLAGKPVPIRVTLVIGGIESHVVDLSEEAVGTIFESARSQKVQVIATAGDKSIEFEVPGT